MDAIRHAYCHLRRSQLTGRLAIEEEGEGSGYLTIGQVQPPQVGADHPYLQGAMMGFQNRAAQVTKLLSTAVADTALTVRIAAMVTPLKDRSVG